MPSEDFAETVLAQDIRTGVKNIETAVKNIETAVEDIHQTLVEDTLTAVYMMVDVVEDIQIHVEDIQILVGDIQVLVGNIQILVGDIQILVEDIQIPVEDIVKILSAYVDDILTEYLQVLGILDKMDALTVKSERYNNVVDGLMLQGKADLEGGMVVEDLLVEGRE